MAKLDPRLVPLIETLSVSGADWLAFEMLESLKLGRVVEDAPDVLARARNEVRRGGIETSQSGYESADMPTESEPIVGDAQIDWAVQYADERLSEVVAMLIATFSGLEDIVRGNRIGELEAPSKMSHEVSIVLQYNESHLSVERNGAIEAMAAIKSLRSALNDWSGSVREGEKF